jgi:hypothetical protein
MDILIYLIHIGASEVHGRSSFLMDPDFFIPGLGGNLRVAEQ